MPYTEMWGGRIVTIFMETYRVVDNAVKVRMEEMLNTWRDAGPNGTPLFGPNAQQNIERALWGQSGPPSQQARRPTPQQTPQMPFQQQQQNAMRSPQQMYGSQQILSPRHNIHSPSMNTNPKRSTEAAVMMGRFDRLIAACRHEQRQNPNSFDPARLDALTKLRSIVESTSLSPVELGQIGTQLDALESEIQSRTPQIHSPSNLRNQVGYRATPPNGHQIFRSPSQQNGAAAIPPSLMGALANLGKLSGNLTPPTHRSTPPPAPLVHQGGAANVGKPGGNSALDLIANLRSAGLLPAAAIPDQDAEYCNMVKGMNIRLITTDLQKEVPLGSLDAISSKELPLQCRQCTNRYPSGDRGQASLDKHLDWHFRQNRRAKDSAVRGQSRSWFSKLEDWIRGGHDDVAPSKHAGQGGEGQDGNGNNGGIGASLTPAQEAELKAATKAFVIAPSEDPDAATRPCPVCKELFKSEWSEDEEEWIWKNCKLVDGIYYHGSCYYSAKTLSTNVNKKNLPGSSSGSRDGTPQPTTSAKPPNDTITRIKEEEEGQATSGIKRKSDHFAAEEKDVENAEGEEESQASKRQALSPKAEEEIQIKTEE